MIKDLTGQKVGRLTVLSRHRDFEKKRTNYECLCDCGNTVIVFHGNLNRASTSSCGCLQKDRASAAVTKHGMYGTREYYSWQGMLSRCYNESTDSFKYCGGRGIIVENSWHKFLNFYSDMGNCPEGCSLDRIDVNGNYCKDNCRWASREMQAFNKRSKGVLPKGVREEETGGWSVSISVCGVKKYYGIFNDLDEAINTRYLAELKHLGELSDKSVPLDSIDYKEIMEATHSMPNTNTSGRVGVTYYYGKWVAKITYKRKCYHLGTFDTFEEAVKAREGAEIRFYGEILTWNKRNKEK